MIPYIRLPDLAYVHPFGILVASGVLVGTAITTNRAKKLHFDVVQLNSMMTWMLVSGFVLSHMLDSLFYHWDEVLKKPWSLLWIPGGLSSFGGFIGALVGILLWKFLVIERGRPRLRERPAPILPFADLVVSVFPIGWVFGRAGCSSVHDHPGARATSDTLLAVAYPTPQEMQQWSLHDHERYGLLVGHDPRWDLGMLELLFTIIVAACFIITWRRRLPTGSYVVAASLSYAPVRFAMDFLRIPQSEGGDTRYASLTPAQYACVALFLYGVAMIVYMRYLKARGIDPADQVRVAPPVETGPDPSSITA
jgi:phosphatidylglycerol:prolipoprotein diacylglycerol transferase